MPFQLNLSVPSISGPLGKEIETNPKRARAWIDTLPLTKTIDAAKQVLIMLTALNRGKVANEERVELIEVYRPTVKVLLEELEVSYAYASLPLQAKQREAFDLARSLTIELAIPYKHFAMEKVGKLIGFGNKKALPLPLTRVMEGLRALMLQSYKTYHPVPPGVWREASNLFLYAEEQGFVKDVADPELKVSINDMYFELLMLSLADPYRLMYRELDRVVEILAQNRGGVETVASPDGLDPQKLFVMAFDGDQGPKVLIQGNRAPAGQLLRIVNPSRLVERIQSKLKASLGTTQSRMRGAHDITDLMSRLVRLWGDPPKRQFRRNPADTGVALCAGVKAISYFAELAANESPERDAEAIRDGGTMPLLKIPQDPASQMIGVEEWHVLNQSANGLRLHRTHGGNVSVTVGECVGVRFVGGASWNLGVVRWLTLLEGNALEFGVELLAPATISVTIEPTIGSLGKPMPAVLIPSMHAEVPADTLLAAPDTFADLREFSLSDHGETFNVRATQLFERTSRFDYFQFQAS